VLRVRVSGQLDSRARQAATAGAIAPDSSPCDALLNSVLQGPLRPVNRPLSTVRVGAASREAAIVAPTPSFKRFSETSLKMLTTVVALNMHHYVTVTMSLALYTHYVFYSYKFI
jgi:hypothetical protein